ncbi:unnamed protein product, partial [Amoebophrya sp. A25]
GIRPLTAPDAQMAMRCSAGYLPSRNTGHVFGQQRAEILQMHRWYSSLSEADQGTFIENRTFSSPEALDTFPINGSFFPRTDFQCAKNPEFEYSSQRLGPNFVSLLHNEMSIDANSENFTTNMGSDIWISEPQFRFLNLDERFQNFSYNYMQQSTVAELRNVTVRYNVSSTSGVVEQVEQLEERMVDVPLEMEVTSTRLLEDNFLSEVSPNTNGLLLTCCDTIPDYCPPIGQIEDASPTPNRILLTSSVYPEYSYTPAKRVLVRNPGKKVEKYVEQSIIPELNFDPVTGEPHGTASNGAAVQSGTTLSSTLFDSNSTLLHVQDGSQDRFELAQLGSCAMSLKSSPNGAYARSVGSRVGVTCPPGATIRNDEYLCTASAVG